jgi:hypothetical protein
LVNAETARLEYQAEAARLEQERDQAQRAWPKALSILQHVYRCCNDEADWDTIDADEVKAVLDFLNNAKGK